MTEREISRMAIRIVRTLVVWVGMVLHVIAEGLLTALAIIILLVGAVFIIIKDGIKFIRRLRRQLIISWRRTRKQ